jgi:hypothetical protein
MTPELQQHLEQEYRDFEEQHFRGESFWRTPLSTLKGTLLFPLFERFRASFPDHPTEDNTVFYLMRGPRSGGYSVYFVCTHFEDTSPEDVRALADFLDEAASVIGRESGSSLDFLAGETVMACFYEPSETIVSLIQQYATRLAAS